MDFDTPYAFIFLHVFQGWTIAGVLFFSGVYTGQIRQWLGKSLGD